MKYIDTHTHTNCLELIEKYSNIIDEIESEIFINTTDIKYDIEHQILGHPTAVQGTVRYWWATKYLQFDEHIPREKEEMKILGPQVII